jgi:hypothetical protein
MDANSRTVRITITLRFSSVATLLEEELSPHVPSSIIEVTAYVASPGFNVRDNCSLVLIVFLVCMRSYVFWKRFRSVC